MSVSVRRSTHQNFTEPERVESNCAIHPKGTREQSTISNPRGLSILEVDANLRE
ncbi:MAG: hypothetical protein OER80_03910 [Gammaproteobacteria bacterium]|nr:hypothetical protein [Gammaproteobacteria bacterium]